MTSADPDKMIRLPLVRDWEANELPLFRDYDTLLLIAGGQELRLDLDGIGQLTVALDEAARQIRAMFDEVNG